MKEEDLKKYEKLLLEKRQQLLNDMGTIRKDSFDDTAKEIAGDLSAYSFHMADQGTDAMEREKAFMLASKSGRLIYHIDEALRRIKNGKYGNCLECGKPISAARLKSVPHARMCIKCKEAEEIRKTREG